MAHRHHVRPLLLGLALFSLLWAAPANAAEVQQARWGFATDLGLWTGTTNNTTFALGFGSITTWTRIFRSAGWHCLRRSGT